MDFSRIFSSYCAVLAKHKEQLHDFQFYPERLNEIKKSIIVTKDSVSYSFSTIKFVIPKQFLPSHSIPRTLGEVEIILKINDEIVIKRTKSSTIEDPLYKLDKFNIILNCDKQHYTASWHLDRHVLNSGDGIPKNLHPIYHLTFGGYHMENLQKDGNDEFGKSLIVRAPRIMHPPMELLLGIDFILNNYIPRDALDLLSDGAYLSIIKELKKYFWMPFALAISKNYCDRIEVDGNLFQFDENFVSSVLTC